MNNRYLWLLGENETPYIIVTAGDEGDAYKIAIRMRVKWAEPYPEGTTWQDKYRDAIRWFREHDRIVPLDGAPEIDELLEGERP